MCEIEQARRLERRLAAQKKLKTGGGVTLAQLQQQLKPHAVIKQPRRTTIRKPKNGWHWKLDERIFREMRKKSGYRSAHFVRG